MALVMLILPHPHSLFFPWSGRSLEFFLQSQRELRVCFLICSPKPNQSADKQGRGWAQVSRALGRAGGADESNGLGL